MHLPYLTSNSSYPLHCFLHVFLGLPLGLTPSTTKSIHFYAHCHPFLTYWHTISIYCVAILLQHPPISTYLSVPHMLIIIHDNLTPHIWLTIPISALDNVSSFSLLIGQVSLPCSKQLHNYCTLSLLDYTSDTEVQNSWTQFLTCKSSVSRSRTSK